MSKMVIKVDGPKSYKERIKVKGLKPEKKITVSSDLKKIPGIRRALNDHATRLFVVESGLDSLTCRISNERSDIDTLFIEKEQLYTRTNVLLAISIAELILIIGLAIMEVL